MIAAFAAASALNANVVLAPVFSDNAVLQRDCPVPVWGKADPGEKVSVSFKGQTKQTSADANGKWKVSLDKLSADGNPAVLMVKGNNEITLQNIVVGDVWLCGGQSNMAFLVKNTDNAKAEVANSANPLIRHNAAPRSASSTAQDVIKMSGWVEASPKTTGDFTAAGYYMARELQKELGIPIGLLNISYGGTQVESWMSPDALKVNPQSAAVAKRWEETLAAYPEAQKKYERAKAIWEQRRDEAKAAGKPFKTRAPQSPAAPGTRTEPSSLYNAMLHPSIPYAICGIIWYQGEANAERYDQYADLIQGLVKQWRAEFGCGNVPFYYVELANFIRTTDLSGVQWAYQREAQRGALREPNTGLATAIDIGLHNNIHPTNKQDVGHRLAINALAQKYGKQIEYQGPLFKDVSIKGNQAVVSFTHADGLTFKGTEAPGFMLAGADKVFYPAKAKIAGNTVVLTADNVPAPVAVRYIFANDPKGVSLYNAASLPALPFRTDNWTLETVKIADGAQ